MQSPAIGAAFFVRRRCAAVMAIAITLLLCTAFAARIQKEHGAGILRAMARIYMSQGDYDRAQPLLEQALALARARQDNNSEISACLLDLAWLCKGRGLLGEAQAMCERGLQLQRSAYYNEHPCVAYTLRILASIYQQQGSYARAGEALDLAMTIMLKCHQPDDPILAPLQAERARLLAAQGKFDEAETQYCTAFEIINTSFGPDHPYTAGVAVSIADVHAGMGRFDEAEQLIDRAQAIQERVYGRDNHLLAPTYLTRARIHYARGEYGQAEKLAFAALILIDAKLGATHPSAGEAFALLAQIWLADGRLDEAEQAGLYALAAMKEDSSGSAMCMNTLARVYLKKGRYDRAEQFALRASAALAGILDPEHPNIKEVRRTMAMLEHSRGRSARQVWASPAVEVLTRNKAWLVIGSGLSRIFNGYRLLFSASRPAASASPAQHQSDV